MNSLYVYLRLTIGLPLQYIVSILINRLLEFRYMIFKCQMSQQLVRMFCLLIAKYW